MKLVNGIRLAAIAGLAMAGCVASTPPLVSVTGTVKLDGKPVPGAAVVFRSVNGDLEPIATATTDTNGFYHLRYRGQSNGAPVGEYKVTLSTERPDIEGAEVFPDRYHNPELTILKVTVTEGGSTLDLDAQSKPSRPR